MAKIKPKKNWIIKRKEYQSVQELAQMLEDIAAKLKAEGSFSITEGEKTTTIAPGQRLEVEIEYSTKGNKHEFEIELEWREGSTNKSMVIE